MFSVLFLITFFSSPVFGGNETSVFSTSHTLGLSVSKMDLNKVYGKWHQTAIYQEEKAESKICNTLTIEEVVVIYRSNCRKTTKDVYDYHTEDDNLVVLHGSGILNMQLIDINFQEFLILYARNRNETTDYLSIYSRWENTKDEVKKQLPEKQDNLSLIYCKLTINGCPTKHDTKSKQLTDNKLRRLAREADLSKVKEPITKEVDSDYLDDVTVKTINNTDFIVYDDVYIPLERQAGNTTGAHISVNKPISQNASNAMSSHTHTIEKSDKMSLPDTQHNIIKEQGDDPSATLTYIKTTEKPPEFKQIPENLYAKADNEKLSHKEYDNYDGFVPKNETIWEEVDMNRSTSSMTPGKNINDIKQSEYSNFINTDKNIEINHLDLSQHVTGFNNVMTKTNVVSVDTTTTRNTVSINESDQLSNDAEDREEYTTNSNEPEHMEITTINYSIGANEKNNSNTDFTEQFITNETNYDEGNNGQVITDKTMHINVTEGPEQSSAVELSTEKSTANSTPINQLSYDTITSSDQPNARSSMKEADQPRSSSTLFKYSTGSDNDNIKTESNGNLIPSTRYLTHNYTNISSATGVPHNTTHIHSTKPSTEPAVTQTTCGTASSFSISVFLVATAAVYLTIF